GFGGEFGDGELAALREVIAGRGPGYGASRLGEVLGSAGRAAGGQDGRPRVVAVVSPWAGDAGWLGRSAPTDAAELPGESADAARWVVSRPGLGGGVSATNVGVAAVEPERSVLVAEADGGWRASATAGLRRWGDASDSATRRVRVRLAGVDGATLAEAEREVVFGPGEREALVTVDLSVSGDAVGIDAGGGAAASLPAVWWAELADVGDALSADDAAASVVELRRRLNVLLIDDGGAAVDGAADGLSAGQWAELALSPGGSSDVGGLTVTRRSAERELSDEVLAGVDAVFVLAGDRLDDAAWARLGAWMRAGGLVWVTPSSGEAGGEAGLSAALSGLGLGGMVEESVAWSEGEAGEAGGWRLSSEAAVPGALRSLGVEWVDLLSPVRVWRWVPVSGLAGDGWLALSGVSGVVGGDEGDESVVLRYVPAELGGAWVMGVPFDAEWTNLVVRPLVVPLLHEGLRNQLRPSRASGVVSERAVVGSALPGPGVWVAGVGAESTEEVGEVAWRPGLWRVPRLSPSSESSVGGSPWWWVVVGMAAGSGDTAVVDASRLEEWLTAQGEWAWLETGSVSEAMATGGSGGTWTWVLLWAVLALALIEAWLSRVFSHAGVTSRAGLARRVGRLMALLRHEPVSSRLSERGRAA
ncbi:MAG: hypothetical protein AAGA57_09875, partial [Planctomycetota bacterium]